MARYILTLLIVTLCSTTSVFAAHPLVSDDAGTNGSGRYQLEVNGESGVDRQQRLAGETKTAATQLAVMLSAGISATVDLVAGIPWQWHRVREDDSLALGGNGAGDASLELKWRFFERDGFGLAVKPGITLPTGDASRGLGNGRLSGGITMIATKELAPVTINLNLAYFRNEFRREADRLTSRRDIGRSSLSVQRDVAKNLQLAGEVGLESNGDRSSRTWPAFALGGVIYSLQENFAVDLGIRAGLNHPAPDLSLLAGMTVHF